MIEQSFRPVKLFTGLIYRDEKYFHILKTDLENRFSPVDIESPEIPFSFTDYYHREMGQPLFRRFLSFSGKINPVELAEIKQYTNQLELKYMEQGGRVINLDPGYISDANVIIATAKNHYHRVPLKNGIYAHIEYVIKNKHFSFLEWTYPDFKSQPYLDFFYQLKGIFKNS